MMEPLSLSHPSGPWGGEHFELCWCRQQLDYQSILESERDYGGGGIQEAKGKLKGGIKGRDLTGSSTHYELPNATHAKGK